MKKTFNELVGEALGRAAMAWSETPKGIFDSDTCSVLHIDIMNAHNDELKLLKQKCYDMEMALGPSYEWSYENGVTYNKKKVRPKELQSMIFGLIDAQRPLLEEWQNLRKEIGEDAR